MLPITPLKETVCVSHIVIREQVETDDASVVDLWNRTYPDLPPLTVELYRGEYASRAPHAGLIRFVALSDGAFAGAVSLEEVTWLQTPHVYFVELAVASEWQGRGVGRRLGAVMDEAAALAGAGVLYVKVHEGDERAERFGRVRGFTPTGDVDHRSRLDVARASLDGLAESRARLHARGIRVARLAELHPDDALLHALHAVTEETEADIPSVELFGGHGFEAWHSRYIERPGMSPEWIWVALDGDQPVGVAYLRRYTDEVASNSYTGVARAHRGLGIARTLKLEQVEWAQQHGIQAIYTGNDGNNAPMLAVNIALGYEFLPALIELGKELTEQLSPGQ
jgi:GNAT superfamily N-acetyltransferase